MKTGRLVAAAVAGSWLSIAAGGANGAVEYTFEKVAETGVLAPGGHFTMSVFNAPSLSRGNLAFHAGDGSGERHGVFTTLGAGGGLTRVVDTATVVPGTNAAFRAVGTRPLIDGDTIAVRAVGANDSETGFYLYNGPGTLTPAVTLATEMPETGGPFLSHNEGALHDGRLVVSGSGLFNVGGIYITSPGGLTKVVDTKTLNPATGTTFDSVLSGLRYDGGRVAFIGMMATKAPGLGFYTAAPDGSDVKLEVSLDSVPGPEGPYRSVNGDYGFDAGAFAWTMTNNDRVPWKHALFMARGGQVTRLLDSDTPLPDGTGTFNDLSGTVALDGRNLLFQAAPSLGTGRSLYRSFNGALAKVIGIGDVLDGKTIKDISYTNDGISGDDVAFGVRFMDDSFAIYKAPVLRGSAQIVPIAPTAGGETAATFVAAPTDKWVDAPLADELAFRAAEGSSFTDIAELPTGYGQEFEVVVDGKVLGRFEAGESVDFASALGNAASRLSLFDAGDVGVSEFVIRGIDGDVTPLGAEGFAIKLGFDEPTASFSVSVVPEPAAAVALSLTSLLMWRRRGDRSGRSGRYAPHAN